MSNVNAAALTAGPLWRLRLEGRLLNTLGIASLATALAVFMVVNLSVVERTGIGLLAAAAMIIGGDLLSVRSGKRGWWSGTSLMVTGYALATFFALSTYYLAGITKLNSAYTCWLLELTLGAAVAVHSQRNSVLRWVALPFTAVLTGHVLLNALSSSATATVLGFTVDVSAAASIVGLLWLAGLSALYKELETRFQRQGDLVSLLNRIAHEAYFFLAAAMALAVPKFCNAGEYAPLWWAIETPILLAICWRSTSFVKHALVMGVWSVSAVLVLITRFELDLLACMAIPLSGIAMALTYRYVHSNWAQWQKITGYGVYLYGSAIVGFAAPLLRLDVHGAIPFFLVEAGVLIGGALFLRDRVLHALGILTGVASLSLYGAQWQEWGYFWTGSIVAVCYALSRTYGIIWKNGGLPKSDFSLLDTPYIVKAWEAKWLERGAATAGYATLIAGSWLLLALPVNTIAIAVEALLLIGLGFATDKRWHRLSGVLAIFIACGKLWILDLSGAGAGARTAIGFAVFGVCAITAGITYLVEYVWKSQADTNNGAPPDNEQ